MTPPCARAHNYSAALIYRYFQPLNQRSVTSCLFMLYEDYNLAQAKKNPNNLQPRVFIEEKAQSKDQ